MSESFLYCWIDSKTNKLYVGKHKGSLDDGYICSSKSMMKEYNDRPQDFSRQIVAEGTDKDICALEATILRSANAHLDEGYYNLALSNGVCFATPEIRKRMSESAKARSSNRKGVKLSSATKRLISKNSGLAKRVLAPYGTFDSRAEFSKFIGVSQNSIRVFFKRLDTPLDGRGNMKLYNKQHIGRTPRQIGYA